MTDYKEEDYLLLSGIQHFVFCRRQWALIHIEQEWDENILTIEGHSLHEKVHDATLREKRGDKLYVRGMPVHSPTLGIRGICDMVEFKRHENGVPIHGEEGLFIPKPIEYKKGKPKSHDADILQLTAQAMCLEEMMCVAVEDAAIFYFEVKRRQTIKITNELRNKVKEITEEMYHYFKKRHTPRVKTGKHCISCSLRHICLPELMERESVSNYMNRLLSQ